MVKRGMQIGGTAFLLGYLLGRRRLDRLIQLASLAASGGPTGRPRKLVRRTMRRLARRTEPRFGPVRWLPQELRQLIAGPPAPRPATKGVTRKLRELLPSR